MLVSRARCLLGRVARRSYAFVSLTIVLGGSSCRDKGVSQSELEGKIEQARQRLEEGFQRDLSDQTKSEEDVEFRYSVLRTLLDKQVEDARSHKASLSSTLQKNDPGPDLSAAYHPLEQQEVERVFKKFGSLYIDETRDEKGEMEFRQVKAEQPWGGYWYPMRDHSIFDGDQAVLKKWDQLMRREGRASKSVKEEKNYYKGYSADTWEGYCGAWSFAAMTPEPRKEIVFPATRHDPEIVFSIADQKALRTFAHNDVSYHQYGITYRGNAETDGTYQDMRPEAFHKLILEVVGRKQQPVVVDTDPGIEIWNKPLYGYRYRIEKDLDFDNAFIVEARAYYIRHRHSETDDKTSRTRDGLRQIYHYRLFVNPNKTSKDGYKVIAGQWIEESFRSHPDKVMYPRSGKEMRTHNEEFNRNLDKYKTLFLDSSK